MRRLRLSLVILTCTLTSCTIQKRLYRPGFFISAQGYHAANHLKNLISKSHVSPLSLDEPCRSIFPTNYHSPVDSLLPVTGHANKVVTRKRYIPILKNKIHLTKKSDVSGPIQNHVPKAAFRLMLFSLAMLGGGYFVALSFPQWPYVVMGLLIIAFIYALVSFITAINAHRDKINNSKGWLVMSTIIWIFDLLIIACAALLFISLF